MNNAEDLTKAMDMAKESIGSVDEEVAVVMDSFEKRVEVMKNAWSSLANTTLDSDLVKGVIDFTTSTIKLMDACGGLVPVLGAVGVALAVLKFAPIASAVKSFATMLGLAIPVASGLTVSVTALNVALSAGIIGLASVAIMGLGYAFKYASEHNKRLAEAVTETTNRITELNGEIATLNNIENKTDAQKEKLKLLNEELVIREKILEKQKQEQAQALAGKAGETNLDKYNARKNSTAGMTGLSANGTGYLGDITSNINEIKNLENEIEKLREKQNGLSEEDKKYIKIQDEINDKLNLVREKRLSLGEAINSLQENYKYLSEEQQKSFDGLQQGAEETIASVDKLTGDFDVQDIIDNNRSALETLLAKQKEVSNSTERTTDSTIDYEVEAKKLNISVSDLKASLLVLSQEQNNITNSTKESTKAMADANEVFASMVGTLPTESSEIELLNTILKDLENGVVPAEEGLEKLNEKFPNLLVGCKSLADGISKISSKISEIKFDEVTNNISDLTGILEDLEAGNGITASSFKKLSENFPELLGYMSDEATLTKAISNEMEELKNTQNDAYKNMLLNSEEYYNNNIKNNEEASSQILANVNQLYQNVASGCSELFSNLSLAYEGDSKNWKSLAQGKASVEEQLINKLGMAWKTHFGNLMTNYAKVTSAFAQVTPEFDEGKFRSDLQANREQYAKDNPLSLTNDFLSHQMEESLVAKAKKDFEAQSAPYMEFLRQQEKAKQALENTFADISFDMVDIKVGGAKSSNGSGSGSSSSSEKYPSYISSLYEEIIDSIMEGQEKLERTITNTNSKIELAQIQGNDGVSAFINNISKVRDELEEFSKVGNVDFTVRPKVDSSVMQQAGWNFEDGGYATTFTQGEFLWQGDEENGQYVYVHYTPILPDGTVLTSNELDNYLHNTLEHSQNILDNDNLNIVMKVDETSLSEEEIKNFLNTGAMTSQVENFIQECSKWDDMVHTAQEQFYEGAVDLSREGIQALIETGKIGVDSEIALRSQQEQLYKQRVDSLKKATEDIIEVRRKAVQELNSKGYTELKNLDLTNLTELELEKALKEIEIQIDKANTSDNAKLKANLDYKKNLISDLGNSIIKANEQINQLASDTLTANKDLMSIQSENLDRVFDIKIRALEREEKILDIRKSMLVEDGGEYDKAEKDSTKILQLNQRTLDILASKRKACEEQIREYRKLGYDDESEKIQGLIDKWASYEQARLAMVKQIAETERQNKIDATQKQLDDLNKSKGYMKDLLSLTINMLKKETEEKKEALKEQYDNKKEALKDEYEAEKDALKKKLDLLKEEADARKKALDKEKDERDYNEEVAEKQREISKIKQQITELSLDDSLSSKKKKKQLEEELKNKQAELDKIQYNHSIDLQKEAIDEELELQEDKINKQLEALEDQHKKELEAEENKYKAQLKVYEDYLKNQSKLKEEASRLIESKEQGFYERLKTYAMDYTDTTQAEFENCWNKAYEALEKYGAKQGDVLATIEQMTQSIITLTDEMERLNETTYNDFINDNPNTNNDDYKFAGDSVGSSNKTDSSEKYGGLVDKSAREKFRDEQLEKMISLGDQMKNADPNTIKNLKAQQAEIAKTIGAYMQGNTYYIMIDGKKYPIRNAVGIRTRHQGIETGEVGSPYGQFKLKSNEELNKLLDGEIVLNEGQSQKINDIVKSLAQNNGVGKVAQVTIDMHDFNVTEDTLPDLKKFIKEQIPKVINDKLFSKGIK